LKEFPALLEQRALARGQAGEEVVLAGEAVFTSAQLRKRRPGSSRVHQ